MKVFIAAIHGIMTGLTDASWPDHFEAWLLKHDPEVHVEKRKYFELPTPRLNWFKNRWLARGLANEIEAVLVPDVSERRSVERGASERGASERGEKAWPLPLWFVAHSNGAVVSLMAARILIARGYRIGGMILTGAAVEADICRNGILKWYCEQKCWAALAYSSPDDQVTAGDPRAVRERGAWGALKRFRDWIWGRLMWPYGCLGRTGWLRDGARMHRELEFLYTRWQKGGHSTYFTEANRERTFEQMHQDIATCEVQRKRATGERAVMFAT